MRLCRDHLRYFRDPRIALHAIRENAWFEDTVPKQHTCAFLHPFRNAGVGVNEVSKFTDGSAQSHHQGNGLDRA